jgi:hypothetical protein
MLIRVELGKGGKNRFAMLSPQLLANAAPKAGCCQAGTRFCR